MYKQPNLGDSESSVQKMESLVKCTAQPISFQVLMIYQSLKPDSYVGKHQMACKEHWANCW